ncbi:MAG: type II toxin-antitoxin system prevent-host-death family antitoxin [Boseongicola sp.]|nr:type II toxin-antitoxin system prevent-host-death family antitoxin [Boseongicola sp.]
MQPIPEFRASDFTRHRSDLFDAAIRSPAAVTRHRRPKFVLMCMDQRQNRARGGTRQVHMLGEMADDLRASMIEGPKRNLQPNVD